MKRFILLFTLAISACSPENNPDEKHDNQVRVDNSNPAYKAIQYISYTESTHRSELRDYLGVDPVTTEWCAAFVNAVLEESGIPSNNHHNYPLTARSFLDWGAPVDTPEPGDIVIFPRGNEGWQGHVGFYVKTQRIRGIDYYIILGGNQHNKVSMVLYRASKALGIRRNIV